MGLYLVPRFVSELGQVQSQVRQAIDAARNWLVGPPLALNSDQVEMVRQRLLSVVGISPTGSGGMVSMAFDAGLLVVEVLAGLVLALVTAFFLIKDGDEIASWAIEHLSDEQREPARRMGRAAWSTLTGYLWGVALLALFNAVLTAIGLAVIGVPLIVALAVIEFFFSWVPIVGALAAGAVAVLVALVTRGLTAGLLVLGLAVLIDQVEGHFFQPVVIGRRVRLHPVVILGVLTAAGLLAGVVGALFAVPVTAVVVAALGALRRWREDPPVAACGDRVAPPAPASP